MCGSQHDRRIGIAIRYLNPKIKQIHADKDYAISVFNSHIEEVKAVVPANRYVSYNAFCFISLSGLFWSFVSYTLM